MKHGGARASLQDPLHYEERRLLFEQRLAAVFAHNRQRERSWTAGVNKFSDYSDQELRRLLGHRRSAQPSHVHHASFLEVEVLAGDLPSSIDYVNRTTVSSGYLRDQGHCGSCWAVAAVAALEMHAEIQLGHTPRLSTQQVIDCTPNPKLCGGQGGCKGATSELALEYIRQKGLALDADYSARPGSDSPCSDTEFSKVARITGWSRVPANDGPALLQAVATKGPILLSVGASNWFMYQEGIFDNCDKDVVINHAVILVGFGQDGSDMYWKIRNSWGEHWGEDGYMRIKRHNSEHDQYCGIDREPEKGFGCKGGPSEVKVCGMCGILSHPSFPDKVMLTK